VALQQHVVIQDRIVIPFTLLQRALSEQALRQQALRVQTVVFVRFGRI